MPDIDTDFCVERRDEVIAYVTEKYGKDRVAQIVTFGTMAARAAIRDAGRALGVPLPDVDRVAKLIPSGPGGLTIAKALEQIRELKVALRDRARKFASCSIPPRRSKGLARNAGTHAAGVVISAGPLIDYAPLVRFNDGGINTQYDMEWVEKIGLLKMDFLGLRNLTVMNNAVKEIRRTTDPEFDLSRQSRSTTPKTFEMLGARRDDGRLPTRVRRHAARLRRAASRRASKTSSRWSRSTVRARWSWIPQYIAIKHGRTKPQYLHPKLEPILAETYWHRLLSRTGHADRARRRRVHDGRSRRTAQGHGEEAEGEDPVLPREVRRRARWRRRASTRSSRRKSSSSSSRSPDTASTSRTLPRTAGSPIRPRT